MCNAIFAIYRHSAFCRASHLHRPGVPPPPPPPQSCETTLLAFFCFIFSSIFCLSLFPLGGCVPHFFQQLRVSYILSLVRGETSRISVLLKG
jgi:hypothetical protein